MIWLLLAVFLFAALLAAIYEYVALRTGRFPVITSEVRHGERAWPMWYAPVFFALGALAGHFWQ